MAELIRVSDADDPRVAVYRDIRERDLVGRQGRFVAEGRVVLNVLLASGRFEAESILVLDNRLAGVGDLLGATPAALPVYVASQAVLDRIAGFHLHRGILGIGRHDNAKSPDMLLGDLPPDGLVVAMAGISNHDNVGAIFRNAAAFGADAVLLDDTCCDPLYRKAIRVSVGAALKVPFARGGRLEDMIAGLTRHRFDVLALSPGGSRPIEAVGKDGRQALLLGSEGHGLPREALARLNTVRIPMARDFDSLNVGAAAAVALHRLWRERP